jgi:hypothetical protein
LLSFLYEEHPNKHQMVYPGSWAYYSHPPGVSDGCLLIWKHPHLHLVDAQFPSERFRSNAIVARRNHDSDPSGFLYAAVHQAVVALGDPDFAADGRKTPD